ncbi:MAG TPA: hypothetical protein VGN55_19405 [Xanthobacteraceae bacterium]
MMIVVAVMMLDDHDFVVMVTIPIAVMVAIADADGNAVFRKHHRLLACHGPGQGRGTQDCERARDKSQLMHVIFLQWSMLLSCLAHDCESWLRHKENWRKQLFVPAQAKNIDKQSSGTA